MQVRDVIDHFTKHQQTAMRPSTTLKAETCKISKCDQLWLKHARMQQIKKLDKKTQDQLTSNILCRKGTNPAEQVDSIAN